MVQRPSFAPPMVVITLSPGARFGVVVAVECTERASGIGRVRVIAYVSVASTALRFDEAFHLRRPWDARLGASREDRIRLVRRGVIAGRGDASGNRAPRGRGACIRIGGDENRRSASSMSRRRVRRPRHSWARRALRSMNQFYGCGREGQVYVAPLTGSRDTIALWHRAGGNGLAANPAQTRNFGEGRCPRCPKT